MSGDIPLREYIEKIMDEREKHNQLALDLSSRELERRLKELNELRADVIKDRVQFVREDLCRAKVKEMDIWKASVNMSITKIETRSVTWSAAIIMFFVIVQILLRIFKI